MGRCGVLPENSLKIAKEISDMENLNFKGIQFYCGHLQHIKSYRERKEMSLECMKRASDAFSKMEMAGLNCEIFSGTGTGTHDIDCNVKLITDMQVGSYTMMDVEYIEIGSLEDKKTFSKFPPALTILSSVISANHSGHVTIDAGLKGMYRDGAVPRVISNEADAVYEWFGDEQGKIICKDANKKFPLGSKVKLIASHCDPTINLYDYFHVVKSGKLVDFWEIDLRGCSS
jgi:D-serine deaminase-like pyridoxal phosphate-dependent protein